MHEPTAKYSRLVGLTMRNKRSMYSNMDSNTSLAAVGGRTCNGVSVSEHSTHTFIPSRFAWIEVCGYIYVCMRQLVLWVEAAMDDAIHVEVEVVVDDAIRALLWFVLHRGDDAWVLADDPLVERRYSHSSCGNRGQQVKP